MVVWSPSSWDLFKKCPLKYRIKRIDRNPLIQEDTAYRKLAVPGLVVDRLLQFWLHRRRFEEKAWLADNFDMVWHMVTEDVKPKWGAEGEEAVIRAESMKGLHTAVRMLEEFPVSRMDILIQPSFKEVINDQMVLTGFADVVLTDPHTQESILIDFKNNHSRQRVTRDQLLFYQMGLRKSLGLNIVKAGYLMFNPRLEEWKWLRLTERLEEILMANLIKATEQVNQRQFKHKWNHFSCTRFCELRFNCEYFQKLMHRKHEDEIRFAHSPLEV